MVEKAYLVDSSVLVAFYIKDDSCHSESVHILTEIEGSTIVLHPYVIEEVISVLTYKSGVTLAKKCIVDIQKADNITILPVDISADLRSYTVLNKRVSFTDSSLINSAKLYQLPLITFDKQLKGLMS